MDRGNIELALGEEYDEAGRGAGAELRQAVQDLAAFDVERVVRLDLVPLELAGRSLLLFDEALHELLKLDYRLLEVGIVDVDRGGVHPLRDLLRQAGRLGRARQRWLLPSTLSSCCR